MHWRDKITGNKWLFRIVGFRPTVMWGMVVFSVACSTPKAQQLEDNGSLSPGASRKVAAILKHPGVSVPVGDSRCAIVYGYGHSQLLRNIACGRRQEALDSIPKYLPRFLQREALKLACAKGDVELVGALLNRRSLLEDNDVDNLSPLHVAALSNNVKCARMLLDAGANPKAKDGFAIQPIHLAGSPEMIRLLLDRGADLGATDSFGWGIVPYWSFWGFSQNLSLMSELLDSRTLVEESSLSYMTPGMTLLHYAGSAKVVDVLVKSWGIPVNSPSDANNEHGWTPLHSAVARGNLSVMTALLRSGANPDAKDRSGDTPLTLAVRAQNAPAVGLLLLSGASADGGVESHRPGAESRPGLLPPWFKEFVPQEVHLTSSESKDEVRILLEYGKQKLSDP